MKVAIIEDEPLAADKLERQLLQIDDNIEVVAKIQSVQESSKWLANNTCDLLFLDIHLSDGLSFKIFDYTDITIPIIFTTAYDQYAIRAFKVNSVDYLLKPINKAELSGALEKFKSIHNKEEVYDNQLSDILKSIKAPKTQLMRFMVSKGEKRLIVKLNQVAYFFADGKYAFLTTHKGEQFIIEHTLEQLEELLNEEQFFRVNRKYITHIDSIESMLSYSKSRLKLNLNPPVEEDIIISTERTRKFKEWVERS